LNIHSLRREGIVKSDMQETGIWLAGGGELIPVQD
jgi:hypothetical protein